MTGRLTNKQLADWYRRYGYEPLLDSEGKQVKTQGVDKLIRYPKKKSILASQPPTATPAATAGAKTDTPEFKRWSGGAPVIKRGDAALKRGNDIPEGPVVFEVYHGTNRDFDTFEYSKIGTATDTGYFGEGFTRQLILSGLQNMPDHISPVEA